MIKRDKLGRFIKGHYTGDGFKKGHIPSHKGTHIQTNTGRTHFKKGQKPWNAGEKSPKMSGENHPMWKGGKIINNNRLFIWKPNHPFATNQNYVRRSHLVAEKCLGRYLTRQEVIHHINKDKSDDRPKNLYLFASQSKHISYEGLKNKPTLKSNLLCLLKKIKRE